MKQSREIYEIVGRPKTRYDEKGPGRQSFPLPDKRERLSGRIVYCEYSNEKN